MNADPPATLLLARDLPAEVQRLHRARALHRLRAGAYVRLDEWRALKPWERYRMRVLAVGATWSAPVFCLESAAIESGLPIFDEPRDIHLLSQNGKSWREGDVMVHGFSDERAVITRSGLLMTTTDQTAVDLCRVLPPAFALIIADAALRLLQGADQRVNFSEFGRAQANRRGLAQLDWVQQRATPISESPGEGLSRTVIEWLGYEEPELQREFFYEGVHDRSDFYWLRLRKIGESDGYGKYDADDVEASKAHFIREKTREDRLRRHEGGFIRWDWSDSIRWRPLDRKLTAGGLTPVRPQQRAMLATLASNPRSFPPGPQRQSQRAS